MARRRRLAKSGSISTNRTPASSRRWTSREASVLTKGFFPSRTTASWIVVARGAFHSDFGPNDPAAGNADSADQLPVVEQRKAATNGHQFWDVCERRELGIG